MPSTKRILIISGFRIFPTNTGGHLRTGNIARGFARLGHEVLIYSLAGRSNDYASNGGVTYCIDQIEDRLVEETYLGLPIGLLQTIGRRLGLPRVWQYALLRTGLIPRRLKQAIERSDIVFSDLPWCPPVQQLHHRKPWYLISHNLEFKLLEQGTWQHRLAAGWMYRVERGAPRQYLDILACAEEDQAFFRQHDSGHRMKIPVVRNGVDPAVYIAPLQTREAVRAELGIGEHDYLLIFSGSRFGPNVEALEALREFCRTEADFLAASRIYIAAVGSMVKQPFREGALIATGRVPEMVPYFAAADAGLNPVLRGSGANVKLFEYLAARLPVISTAFGVRGTTLATNTDFILIGDDGLKPALQRFVSLHTPSEWRQIAEQVWQRQRSSCDIEEIMGEVAHQLPAFAGL